MRKEEYCPQCGENTTCGHDWHQRDRASLDARVDAFLRTHGWTRQAQIPSTFKSSDVVTYQELRALLIAFAQEG